MRRHMTWITAPILAIGLTSGTGCQSNTGNGALLGGAAGAGLGAIIGHQSGHAAGGALIGGALGAGGGALIGSGMDRKEERQRAEYERQRAYDAGYRDGVRPAPAYYDDRRPYPAPASSYRSTSTTTTTYRSGHGGTGYRETYHEERRY